jgi:adenine-specific DNA-methyltransferase
LKVLQKAYYGKVKMIYIDPPYNTGSDSFVYPDKFSESREDYLKRIEAKDEEGFVLKEGQFRENSKDSGHYHSNWLSMMYPRLFLARNLLREDGVIFVSIDDNEVHNLRLLMNDIFGEENFVGTIVRGTGQTTGQDSNKLGSSFDYVLVFSRTEEFTVGGIPLSEKDIARFSEEDETGKYAYWQMRKTGSNDRREDRPNMFFPVKAPDGSEVFPIGPGGYDSRWRFERKTYKKMVADNMILWKQVNRNGEQTWWPYVKYYLEGRTKRPSPLWDDIDGSKKATRDLKEIFGGKIFNNPKPVAFIQRILEISTSNEIDDIILDFFAGTSTSAEAVIRQNAIDGGNRQFIMAQLVEEIDNGEFGNIAEISKERIRRVIQKLKEENPLFAEQGQDLGFKVFKLKHSNFKLWRGDGIKDSDQLEEQLDLLADPVREAALEENLLTELLLKSGFELTTPVEKKTVGETHYWLAKDEEGNSLAVALQSIDETLLREMITQEPQQVICLDRLFTSDQLKTNIQLQCKDAGIVFHSI